MFTGPAECDLRAANVAAEDLGLVKGVAPIALINPLTVGTSGSSC